MAIVKATDLKKYYGAEPNITKALDGVSLDIEEGEFVAVVGCSGSGKTTLLNMLGGLDRPDSGTVTIDGCEITSISEEERTVFRRKNIGFIFQNFNLVPILSVYENVVLPLELDGQTVEETEIHNILETLGLSSKTDSMPNTLSGGQQQRVAIARALASHPKLILADEPTGNLDSKTGQDVLEILINASRKFNQTVLMITHNDQMAQRADRTLRMEDGRWCK